ncbi:MAG: alpha-ketoacid dehydrogenase subunit beta [Spirochaetia bacterium]|nr:alpha-ketoacid dehydrogenase subunit beta [Spirochaetia bacterium]
MTEEMARDENVVLIGEDVGCYGGCFTVTSGLIERFGERQVIETPVSEEGLVGLSVGAAIMGMRPIVEIMYGDFSTLASDPLINHAAKTRFMSGGTQSVPLVYRTPMGSGTGAAAQHTQNLESLFTNIPGLTVVYPATPSDAKGLMKSAIRSNDPIIFLEHKNYGEQGLVPEGEHLIEIGKADIKRKGEDVTIITYGKALFSALIAAQTLEDDEISAEVIDLRTLRPLDTQTIFTSVQKTGKVVILHEAPLFGGFSGEIVASIVEDPTTFASLRSPVIRIGGKEMPSPFNKNLEAKLVPQGSDIVESVLSLFSLGV